jgi:hypothetical protein
MRITELDLSPAARLCLEVAEPRGTEGPLILTGQPQEDYDSCVGRVHIDSSNPSPVRWPAFDRASWQGVK